VDVLRLQPAAHAARRARVTARRYLVAYIGGELGVEPARDLERHVAGCEPCRRRLEGERKLEERLRSALAGRDATRERAFERALDSALAVAPARRLRLGLFVLAPLVVVVFGVAVRERRASSDRESTPRHERAEAERPRPWTPNLPLRAMSMKPTTLLGAAVLASAATATTTSLLLASPDGEEPRAGAARELPADDSAVAARVEELLRRQGELEDLVARLDRRLAETGAGSRQPLALSESELESAVARVLERREAPAAAPATPAGPTVAAFLRDLGDPALDGSNWDARFTLARHYSDAGMHGDALRQLEALVETQAASPRQAKHARGYLWLGSFYMNAGREADALRTWRDGLRNFPDDAALRARIAAHE
jgi:tetratricopeptide (TPR) repeat protein